MISEDSRNWVSLTLGLIGVAIGVISLYAGNEVKTPKLSFNILTNSEVVEFEDGFANLDIVYNGSSLTEKGQTVSVVTVEFRNSGSAPVTLNDFDPEFPIGFEILGGKVVATPAIVLSNTKYLSDTKLRLEDGSRIILDAKIVEVSDFLRIQSTVVHPVNSKLSIDSFGKIAGIQGIDVVDNSKPSDQRSLLQQVFSGSWKAHALRALITVFILLVSVGLLGWYAERQGDSESSKRSKQSRKDDVTTFKKNLSKSAYSSENQSFLEYIDGGFSSYTWYLRHNSEKYNRKLHLHFVKHLISRGLAIKLLIDYDYKTGSGGYIQTKSPVSLTHKDYIDLFVDGSAGISIINVNDTLRLDSSDLDIL